MGVEITYNCLRNNSTVITDAIAKDAVSGDRNYNIYVTSAKRLTNAVVNGWLTNQNDIGTLDLNRDWWCRTIIENCEINDSLYFTAGAFSPLFYSCAISLAVNLNAAEKYGCEDIQKLVLDGEWTYAKLSECCDKAGQYTNDLPENERFYAMELYDDVLYGFFGSCGGRFSSLDGDGNPVVGLYNDSNIRILETITSLFSGTQTKMSNYQEITSAFVDGRALFCHAYVSTFADVLTESDIVYSIIPIPKYDEAQKNYCVTACPDSNYMLAVPQGLTEDALSFTGALLSAWCYASYDTVRTARYETVLKLRVSLDQSSSDIMDILFENLYFDLNLIYDFGASRSLINTTLKMKAPAIFSSSYNSITGQINADIEALIDVG